MKTSFCSHCQGLFLRLKHVGAQARRRRRSWQMGLLETLEVRTLLSSTPAMVADINPGSAPSFPSSLVAIGSTTYFSANDAVHGTELWKSDGTVVGTVMVKDIKPGSATSYASSLTDVNGTLYFRANDGTHGMELWKSNGTAAGTAMVADIKHASAGSAPYLLTNVNGTLFFTADDGTNGYQLWKSDGTATGTVVVKHLNSPNSWSSPNLLTNMNGTLFFAVNDGAHGDELWKSNGTAAGTVIVKEIDLGTADSNPGNLTNVNGTLFFTANNTTAGEELWKSDGTVAGTVMVAHINPGWISNLTNQNGTLFFSANDGTHGNELWQSNGTAAGTVIVKDIIPGSGSSTPARFTSVNGTLFFAADDGTHGDELWKSDGTTSGTTLVKDIYTGGASSRGGNYYNGYYYTYFPYSSSPGNLTNVNGTLFFQADEGTDGRELWQSDGTSDGTVLLADINSGSSASSPSNLTNVNGSLIFTANDGVHGTELWALNVAAVPSLAVSGFPSISTAGVSGSVTVMAKNADGTTNTGYTGTIHFTSSDPQAVLPADYTFTAADQGTHAFSASLKTAGLQSITATDKQTPGETGIESSILVKPAAASMMSVGGFPSPTTAGAAGNVNVTLTDLYGNIATGYLGTVHFTSSDTKAALPANYVFTAADAGKHTFSATLKTTDTQSIKAVDTVTPALTGSEVGITVKPAAARQFLISAPSSVKAGVLFSLTLMVEDAYGNVVTGYTGKVHFTSTDNTATLPGNYTFAAFDKGVHTFTGLIQRKKGIQSITVTDTLHGSLTANLVENVH